jgi:2-polyprenyl-3-methyl-5-hydroxy-6-metoxy-1,4-benzoquinol methylase
MEKTRLPRSPLTGTDTIVLIDSIDTKDVADIYMSSYGINVSDEFRGVESLNFYRCTESGLHFFYPNVTGSGDFYEKLQKFPWYYQEAKSEFDFAKTYISKGDSVLEVGCGVGHFSTVIDEYFGEETRRGDGATKAIEYVGIEFSSRAKETASAKGIAVINESIQGFSQYNAGRFDIVCSFQVLEHVGDVSSFLEACLRCLKPSGRLIISVPNAESYVTLGVNAVLNMPPHHITWWTEDVFKFVARRYGLIVESVARETLADIHLQAYAATLVRTALASRGKRRQWSLVDRSFSHRLMTRLSTICGRVLSAGLTDKRLRPTGHTLTVVLRTN